MLRVDSNQICGRDSIDYGVLVEEESQKKLTACATASRIKPFSRMNLAKKVISGIL